MAEHVPIGRFGKDHWSTLAYIETRCVDHDGYPDHRHMRTDTDRHPGLGAPYLARMVPQGTAKYPTRLKGGDELHDHDDWDCAYDLEAAGLIEVKGTGIMPWFRITARGRLVVASLRAHKAAGGWYSNFRTAHALGETA